MTRLMIIALAVLAASVSPAFADPIAADGSFHEFSFGGAGSAATSCGGLCMPTSNPVAEQTSSPPWTFVGPATLFVLDLFLTGDSFNVFDTAVLIGATSAPGSTGNFPCGGNIACATGNAEYSQGTFVLGAGAHSITFNAVLSPFGGGAAAFSVSAVPEPGTLTLLGLGLVGAGLLRRRIR